MRRDRCLPRVLDIDGMVVIPQDGGPAPELLELIYAGDRRPDQLQPQHSLVARMSEALDPSPGHAVLEVGAGAGYHAALIASVTGGAVVPSTPIRQPPRTLARPSAGWG